MKEDKTELLLNLAIPGCGCLFCTAFALGFIGAVAAILKWVFGG